MKLSNEFIKSTVFMLRKWNEFQKEKARLFLEPEDFIKETSIEKFLTWLSNGNF